MKKLKSWFQALSMTGKVTTVAVAALLSFGVVGVAAQPGGSSTNNTVTPQVTQPPAAKPASHKVEVKTETKTEPIAFTTSTVNDNTLAKGATQVRTAGVNGVLTHTYQVTYTDGAETSRSAPADTVTTPPINAVTTIGTYVAPAPTPTPTPAPTNCPNGTYVNSAGDTVCSPYASSSAPAGATAQCSDGTYSFSQSHSGTCSHHGGVASWL